MNEVIIAALITLLPFAVVAEILDADEQQAHAVELTCAHQPQ